MRFNINHGAKLNTEGHGCLDEWDI